MKSAIKYGLVTGTISIIFLFGSFTLFSWLKDKYSWDISVSTIRGIGGLLSIPIQAIGIYMAMQNIKKLTGELTYGQALKTGITVAITIALLVALFSFIYCQFLNPGYREYMVHDAQKIMIAKGEGQQDIDQQSVQVAEQFSTGAQVMMALVGQLFSGALITLIAGLFVRSKK